MNAILRQVILLGSAAVLVAACSGGDSSLDPPPSSQPPPGGGSGDAATTLVSGAISGFGSVIVNGVRYETTSTEVLIEGKAATVGELKVGHVVRLEADSDSRGNYRARRIEMRRLLQGNVDAVDPAAGTITIAGQVVRIDDDTSFDDSIPGGTLDGISVGDRIEVHGFIDSDAQGRATRIERSDDGDDEVEVKGRVSMLDSAANRFDLGELRVDYSSARLEGFENASLADGDIVEVAGVEFAADGALIATDVSREDGHLGGHDGDRAEVEGLITRFASGTDFDIDGQPVRTTESTQYRGGTASDLRADIKVEAEGEFDASGVLVAERVQIRQAVSVALSAQVDAVDPEAGSFQALGLIITFDASTRREDHEEDDHFFAVENLRVGNWVEVRGYLDPAGSGSLIASRIERDDPQDEVELRGRAADLNEPLLSIAGVTVETTADTAFEQQDHDIAAATFFAEAGDRIVDVVGDWNGTVLVARHAEIKEERASDGTPPPPIEPPPVGNRAPVANAGAAQTVTVGSPVTLDGSGSSDPDGDTLTYAWVLEAPATSAAALAAADTSGPSFNADAAGSYIATLTVSDGQLQNTASVTITARDPAVNTAPTAVATASKTQAAVGETITLNGIASFDPEGKSLSYSWSLETPNGSSAALSGNTLVSPTFSLDVAGDYTATLRVNDGELDSAPASVKVTATAVIALDGAKLYADNCSGCHGAINAINRMARDKRSATDIRNAINSNKGGMSFLSGLTDEEVQAIADAIAAANP